MKLIIAGSRHFTQSHFEYGLRQSQLIKLGINEIVEGGATGIDRYAREYAKKNLIPFRTFNADWKLYNKSAGPIRNSQMVHYGDALLVIYDGKSKGSKNIITQWLDIRNEPQYLEEIIIKS